MRHFYSCCLVLRHIWLIHDPLDCSPPGSSAMKFPREEYWSGLTFPSPGDLLNPGIKLIASCCIYCFAGRFFTTKPPGKGKGKVAQSSPVLCNPMNYTVHGILQARILEWVVPFYRESSHPRDQTQVFHITGKFFTCWATREVTLCFKLYFFFYKCMQEIYTIFINTF